MNIRDISVDYHHGSRNGVLIMVKVVVEGEIMDEYEAYAVNGLSLQAYLMDSNEIGNAVNFANGRFALPQGTHSDKVIAHILSSYGSKVAGHLDEDG